MIVTEMLNTQDIVLTKKTIPGGENLGERTGSIRSENYESGVSGFKINHGGNVEFNVGIFRGHIEATSGVFHGRIEAEEGVFRGSILSGPLILMDETPTSAQFNYSTGVSAYDIVTTEMNRLGLSITTSYVTHRRTITGTYGTQKIIQIGFEARYVSNTTRSYSVLVTYENGQETEIALYRRNPAVNGNQATDLSNALSFRYTSGGKTFRLTDLPTQDPHIPGAVWRNGNQLMIS